MITKAELEESQANLMVTPMNHSLLVLVPKITETTDSGIIKSDEMMQEEEGKQEAFLTVLAVASDVEMDIKPGDRVYLQGTINTFDDDTIPAELNVAPPGYTVGHTMEMYVKMKI